MKINKNIPLPRDRYKHNKNELYMNSVMLSHFKTILTDWKEDLVKESSNIQNSIESLTGKQPDSIDLGIIEELHTIEYLIAKRDLGLRIEIDKAINRIDNHSYGYCEKTKQKIGVDRLEAWPLATTAIIT
ncbi:MAG: hypothetical protein JKY53_13225 [Flavobacteriales bacterium]|nr:hypothetical protein [Flavobacteriales bacterium]